MLELALKGSNVRLPGCLLLACLLWLGPGAFPVPVGASTCPPTRTDSEGPFYEPNAPRRTQTGQGLQVTGNVQSTKDCEPLPNARIEWWSADREGNYTDQLRATVMTGKDGAYRYQTVFPSGYSFRPPHLHVKVSASGYRTLTTQIYPEPGQKEIQFDFNLVPE